MQNYKHITTICFMFIFFFGVQFQNLAMAGEKITWYIKGFPPAFILDGEYKDQGFADYLIKHLEAAMPDYDHDSVETNLKRTLQSLKTGEHCCYPALLRTPERDQLAYFSAYIWLTPLQLIFNKSTAEKLKLIPGQKVSLEQILKNKDLSVILDVKRRFTKNIDVLVKRYASEPNIKPLVVTPGSSWASFKMVAEGHADYMIEYPWGAPIFLKENGLPEDALVSVQIQELGKKVVGHVAHVACPRTEWGSRVIHEIDDAIQKMANEPAYRHAMQKWLNIPADSDLGRQSEAFYNERASRSWHTAPENK